MRAYKEKDSMRATAVAVLYHRYLLDLSVCSVRYKVTMGDVADNTRGNSARLLSYNLGSDASSPVPVLHLLQLLLSRCMVRPRYINLVATGG